MILQLVTYQPMQTAVLRAALQALHSEKAVVIFECSAGRHRSVGAAEILRQVMQPLVSNIKIIHASNQYWHSTCGGTRTECKQDPPLAFHREIERLRRDLLSQIEREYPVTCAQTSCSSKQSILYKNLDCQVDDCRCQADQQLLDSCTLPSQIVVITFENWVSLSIECKNCLPGGCMFCTIVDSKNQQKMQPRKNHNEKEQEIFCSSLKKYEYALILADPFPKTKVQTL